MSKGRSTDVEGHAALTIKPRPGAMLVLRGTACNGAWNFVDIPDQYVIDKCDRICLLFLRSPWRVY